MFALAKVPLSKVSKQLADLAVQGELVALDSTIVIHEGRVIIQAHDEYDLRHTLDVLEMKEQDINDMYRDSGVLRGMFREAVHNQAKPRRRLGDIAADILARNDAGFLMADDYTEFPMGDKKRNPLENMEHFKTRLLNSLSLQEIVKGLSTIESIDLHDDTKIGTEVLNFSGCELTVNEWLVAQKLDIDIEDELWFIVQCNKNIAENTQTKINRIKDIGYIIEQTKGPTNLKLSEKHK